MTSTSNCTEPSGSESPAATRASTKLNELNLSLVTGADIGDYENASGTVTYTVNGINFTHALYKTMEEANAHPFVCYATDDCFPIQMQSQCFNYDDCHTDSIQGYGITCTKARWSDGWTAASYYATIIVKPFLDTEVEPNPDPSADPDVTTTDEPTVTIDPVLAEKAETLLGALNLTSAEGLDETCRQDLLDFLSGDWDGANRASHDEGYSTLRNVYARVYTCVMTDDATGESVTTKVSLDYVGDLEVMAVLDDEDDFSLVVDHTTGLVEQWSLLEKLNSWQVSLPEGETVDGAVRMFGIDGQTAILFTIDADGLPHAYNLMDNGDIISSI